MEKHKRYLLFGHEQYYPCGGTADIQGSFDTIPEALEEANKRKHDNYELYDRLEGVEIPLNSYGGIISLEVEE